MDDNAGNCRVGVSLIDFVDDFGSSICLEIFNNNTDIFAVFDFEIDVFDDDGIVGIADNEKFGLGFEA